MFADLGVRSAARLWYAKNLAAGGSLPYARDEPRSRFGEGPAEHVLLLGNGAAHGWGVASHQLALCGQLAESLSEATGRAIEVEYVGAELMNAQTAVSWLGDHDLTGYDEVVVVMGMNDAVRLTSVESWERDITALLAHLRSGLRHDAPIVMSGIQPVASVPPHRGVFGYLGQRRADALNAATRRIIEATPYAAFIDLEAPEVEVGRPYGSVSTYRAWADTLTRSAAPLLTEHSASAATHRRAKTATRSWRWAGAPAALAAAADRGTPELRRLVNAAKIEFGTTLAAVTLLEGDRLWFAAASADTPPAIPAELSYDLHMSADEALIVPDAGDDPRFRDNPFVRQSHLPFYAGYPVHDLSGRMLGSFCLLAAQPRAATSVSLTALQTYARHTEQELHRLEREAVGELRV